MPDNFNQFQEQNFDNDAFQNQRRPWGCPPCRCPGDRWDDRRDNRWWWDSRNNRWVWRG